MTPETQYAGAIIIQPELYWQNQVVPDDVRDPTARTLVTVVGDMLREGAAVDVVSVSERARLPLSVVGGICQGVYSPIGAASAAEQIRALAAKRRAEGYAANALEAIREGAEPAAVFSQALDKCSAPVEEHETDMLTALAESDKQTEKPRKLITQIPRLNELVPIDGGKLIIVAGRPGAFKSSLALHVVRYSAVRNMGAGIISLEMPRHEVASRYKLLSDNDRKPVPIRLNCHAQTLEAIETQIIQWVQRDGLNGVVIDYLGLITCQAPKQMRRDEVIGMMTRRFKLLAMRLDIPIILVAQLNRENEKHNRQPILSDLRESGNIEQDADVVLFIHRREVNEDEKFELIIAKHRGGPTGYIDLHIDKPKFRVLESMR